MCISGDEYEGKVNYESSEFKCLAFTLKKLRKPREATEFDYGEVISKWIEKGVIIEASKFELPESKRLHVHGILVLKKNFNKDRLKTYDFSLKLRDIYNWDGWSNYIKKDEEDSGTKIEEIKNDVYMF